MKDEGIHMEIADSHEEAPFFLQHSRAWRRLAGKQARTDRAVSTWLWCLAWDSCLRMKHYESLTSWGRELHCWSIKSTKGWKLKILPWSGVRITNPEATKGYRRLNNVCSISLGEWGIMVERNFWQIASSRGENKSWMFGVYSAETVIQFGQELHMQHGVA